MPDTATAKKPVKYFPPARTKHFRRKRKFAASFAAREILNVSGQLYDCEETKVLACCTNCAKNWYVINRCRLRVCPLCSYRVAKEREVYVHAMCRQMDFPKMITLTMPRWKLVPQDGIKHLRKCFSKLRRTKLFKTVVGGCYQVELVQKEDGWHIHLHALLDAKYIPRQKLWTEWGRIIGEKFPNVKIEAATNDAQKAYMCKYPVKAAEFDLSSDAIVDWYLATKGARLFSTFGKWYNKKIEDLDAEEMAEPFTPVCPHCNEESTTFLARDGPFMYGHDLWRKLESVMTEGKELIIDREDIKLILNGSKNIQNEMELD